MPQGGAFNCDFRFSLIFVTHAKSTNWQTKKRFNFHSQKMGICRQPASAANASGFLLTA
jgi:hypothetical protein